MFLLYVIVGQLVFFLLLPVLLLHPKLRDGFLFRCGRLPADWPGGRAAPVVWFHGASAGDLLALEPLMSRVAESLPAARLVVTTVTNSGYQVARRGLAGGPAYGYAPYDVTWAVDAFVRAIKPTLLVLEYSELWPALIHRVKRSGAAVVLVNGRFSEHNVWRYRLLYRLIGNPLRLLDRLCVRDEQEAARARSIGAEPERIVVTGNTKFDAVGTITADAPAVETLRRELGLAADDTVWLAGSTHDRENDMVLEVFARLRHEFTGLRLVIAPRYLEQVSLIKSLAEQRGLGWSLRSRPGRRQPVIILDSVGELRLAYHLAAVVFVGGSLVRRGGHNILEPAACSKPVLFGPHMYNFRAALGALLGRGGIQVRDAGQLYNVLAELLRRPRELQKLGRLARQALRQSQGATEACWRQLAPLLEAGKREP